MVSELVPMDSPYAVTEDTFVAVDVRSFYDGTVTRLVGSVHRLRPDGFSLQDPDIATKIIPIDFANIEAAWWAPMGYRP